MIGSLARSSALVASVAIPRSSPNVARSVIVASRPTVVTPLTKQSVVVQALKPIPVTLQPVQPLPPPPAARPIVQAGQSIPALPKTAALTSLAPPLAKPFYPSLGPGPSEVAYEPPADARLPAPAPFGTAFGSVDPVYPEWDTGPIPSPVPVPAYDNTPIPVRPAATVTASVSADGWIWAAGGLALAGAAAFVLYRKFGKARR